MNMFNEYQWENYLKAGGDKIVKLFESFLNEDFKNIKINSDFFDTIKRLHEDYCPFNFINKNIKINSLKYKNIYKVIKNTRKHYEKQ